MSRLLDTPVKNGRGTSQTETQANHQNNLDFIKIIWRWKWLPVLGALIGAGVGYMLYTKLPTQYESSALVQVVSNIPISVSEHYDTEKVAYFHNRNDESRAIKSRKVIGLAIEFGGLKRYFPELEVEEIVNRLMDPDYGVNVSPAERPEKSNTQQLIIAYKCEDPELSRAVVDAVVYGYQTFLAEEYKAVDSEMLKYFVQTEKSFSKKYQELFEQHQKFREEAKNVLWNSDNPIDPFADSYVRLKAQVEEIKIQRTKLRGTLQQIEEAQKANRRAEDILVMLHDGSDSVRGLLWESFYPNKGKLESQRLEYEFLTPLRAREQQLLGQLGAAHPTIQSLQREIKIIEERIAVVKAFEEEDRTEKATHYGSPLLKSEGASGDLSNLTGSDEQTDPTANAIVSELSRAEWLANHWLAVRINAMKETYLSLERHENDLISMAQEELKKSQELQNYLQRNVWLKEQLESVKQMLNDFSEKVKAVELVPTHINHRVLKELNPATLGTPAGPYPARFIVGGAALGLLLMSGLAVLMDLADRSYRSPEEIVADLGKPILGHIPAMELQNLKKLEESLDSSIITLHHSRGRIAEAFRSVRTCLFFSSRETELKVIQVTSPVPGDGKSTLSANLAVTMAQSGRRVLLLDADFRRPRQQKLFGIEGKIGMAQVLAGTAELYDATYGTCIANLSLMPGGRHPSNPAELLSSHRFSNLMEILREKYDIIVIDTPPVLAVSDPSVVAAVADGVVVTMRLRRNVRPLASRTFEQLESVNANVLGVVVNGVSTEAAYGGYGYSYSYSDYKDSYRYEGQSYGRYGDYSVGYIEDKQLETETPDMSEDKIG